MADVTFVTDDITAHLKHKQNICRAILVTSFRSKTYIINYKLILWRKCIESNQGLGHLAATVKAVSRSTTRAIGHLNLCSGNTWLKPVMKALPLI